jgi:hypothetical protein
MEVRGVPTLRLSDALGAIPILERILCATVETTWHTFDEGRDGASEDFPVAIFMILSFTSHSAAVRW